ncbi:MAG: hypothetical protein IT560_13740 [Alphaproteobacteria bacterium]|nr:hypothetical protein [Alphaproteobacteria bacterium]
MAQTLEEIREKLETAFNTAVLYGNAYYGSAVGPEHLKAAAELAKAIVAVDDKIDRRNDEKNGPRMPGK